MMFWTLPNEAKYYTEMPLAKPKIKIFVFKKKKKGGGGGGCFKCCDQRAPIRCIDLANIAPAAAHLVELGGSRAVLPLAEMERKTILSIQEEGFFYIFYYSCEWWLISIKHFFNLMVSKA